MAQVARYITSFIQVVIIRACKPQWRERNTCNIRNINQKGSQQLETSQTEPLPHFHNSAG